MTDQTDDLLRIFFKNQTERTKRKFKKMRKIWWNTSLQKLLDRLDRFRP